MRQETKDNVHETRYNGQEKTMGPRQDTNSNVNKTRDKRQLNQGTNIPGYERLGTTCQPNDDDDPDFLAEEILPTELISPKSIQLNLSSTSKSHRRCTVCQKNSSNRHRQVVVPHEARTQAFIDKCIVIPANSRCCPNHLLGNYFTQESISKIPEVNNTTLFNRSDITELLDRVRGTLTLNGKLNFDCAHSLSEEDYQRLTGLTRNQFEAVANTVTDLRKSEIRSVKTCLAILLVKLRTGLSNSILATLFSLEIHQIQRATHAARSSLMKSFVPKFLGFQHMSHEKFTRDHTTPTARTLFADDQQETGILVLDGTYIYLQKSSHHHFQKQTYSMHKGRSLVKPMMIVATDGYILNVLGPYYADGHNNDASIIKHVFKTNADEINTWMHDDDVMVVDRGFRDAEEFLKKLNFKVEMPCFLKKGAKQQTVDEANTTRLVTKVRWVVESANGRIKQWKFLDKVVANHYVPHIGDFVRIVCALVNCFRPPLINDFGNDDIGKEMIEKAQLDNHVKLYVEEHNLLRRKTVYKEVDGATELIMFPRISLDHLRQITMGIYQIKLAKRYTDAHQEDDNYALYICKDRPDLLRVKMQSRHSSSRCYHLWLEYDENDVSGWYCTCKVGSRMVGCCAHIASVVWYLGYQKWNIEAAQSVNASGKFSSSILNAKDVPEESDMSDVESVDSYVEE
ncbi:unnamed protein product [Mytilus edulis]|uniref:SWIM-type domain-containing protein n=1 Tax=Mytilus edulis TaxID=6550 RepID=A0A8S3VBP6_MYTED|nr:unnamed protein product [Mytilus edulis]